MDNEIYGLTKGQAAPTTPLGDKTKSTTYGNPEAGIDPCLLAISFGATWVARAFSGDVKGTAELMKAAMQHRGFAFLNILSPCVTWRGDDQHKEIRAKIQAGEIKVGILHEVQHPTLVDEMEGIREKATASRPAPAKGDLLRAFL